MESARSLLAGFAVVGCISALSLGFPRQSLAGRQRQCSPRQEEEPGWLEGDHFTGDWGGLRTTLEKSGVTFSIQYTHEYLANVSGGVWRGAQYNGLVVAGIELDLKKLAGWQGGLLHAGGLYTLGESLSEFQVGDEGNVSNINFRNSIRLFEAWFQQSLLDGKIALRIGQLAFDSDFAGTNINDDLPGGALFIYSDFGAAPLLSFNVPVPIFAISAPGVMLRAQPTKRFYLQSALYDGNPSPGDFGDPSPDASVLAKRNDDNIRWRVAEDEGLLWVTEIGFLLNPEPEEESPPVKSLSAPGGRSVRDRGSAPEPQERVGEPGKESAAREPGLPGVYKLGFFYHSDEFKDWTREQTGFEKGRDYGFYAIASQMAWREEGNQGLTLFARVGFAPEDRNVLDRTVDGGLVFKGLIPGRDDDDFGVAISYKEYSNNFSIAEVRAGGNPRGHETIVEATYAAKVTGWMSVQPAVQYIWNPAGIASASDAWVVGIRSSIAY